jgi:hypothetical protein
VTQRRFSALIVVLDCPSLSLQSDFPFLPLGSQFSVLGCHSGTHTSRKNLASACGLSAASPFQKTPNSLQNTPVDGFLGFATGFQPGLGDKQ